VNDQTIFEQSETHVSSDRRRAKELQVVTALTVSHEPAVLLYGKGYRLLLPATDAVRIANTIIDKLGTAARISNTEYTTYTLIEQDTHGTDQQQ
jgi:hypothetical protein